MHKIITWIYQLNTNTQIQIHKYNCTNTNIEIQIRKYKYTNTNTQIQLRKYKYTNTTTQIQIRKYKSKAGTRVEALMLPNLLPHTIR